ncbi:(+)-cis,trans-nepetalactol synthase NEPS1-like [Quercus robur]|uniref:(+)-cis,trans-nepetalactol synthase NEPS1-like n=1 Tax=Quercus robur TaxID=38942 RepID=UPI002161F37B|nr:(+)-cis,trans-nepetalactol synthase NEPS1-like [Quercus robur]
MTDSSNKKLQGKVAIITGGASGIGEATAHLFAQHGARMVVIADIQDQLGHQVAISIGINKCQYVHCDVSDEDQVKNMIESTVQKHGQLDIMFSNAGIVSGSDQTILELDLSGFDKVIKTNTRGMALCVKHAARVMVERRVKGSILCTGSIAASKGTQLLTDYCMAKHAVLGLVRSASLQLGQHGIRVNCVSPSTVATPMSCDALGMDAEQVEKIFEPTSSLKGVVLKVRDVANAVLFLASEDSGFVTGLDLKVDGGNLGSLNKPQ